MPVLVYSLLRLAVLAGCAVVLALVGFRGWLLALVAVLLAAPVAYLVLAGPRTAAAAYLAERAGRRGDGQPLDDDAEDAEADHVRGPAALEDEADGEQHAVGELEEPGVAQHHDEVAAPGAAEDHPRQAPHPGREQ